MSSAYGTTMPGVEESVIREPASHTPGQYHQRVVGLACFYLGLFLLSLLGACLLLWQGKLFVTLAQRSNVETLVLAFFLVFFAYIAVIGAPGALGALSANDRDIREEDEKECQDQRLDVGTLS